jgi:hypothetical protein
MAENAFINSVQSIRKFLWNCLFVISYPIITSFSLVFMGIIWIFSSLSQLLSRVSTGKTGFELKKPVWKDLATVGRFKIQKLFVDDILFGPTYYKFKAEPHVAGFENVYYGDFIYPCFNGLLLQKWNSTTAKDLPEFTLAFMDGDTGEITEIEKIKSFSWVAQRLNEDQVKIKWFNGTEGGEVMIEKDKLKPTAIIIGS